MKKALIGVLLLLVGSCAVWAQGQLGSQPRNAAAITTDETSGTAVTLPTPVVNIDLANYSPTPANAEPDATPAAKPPAKPKFVFGERDDYRWQLGVGVEVFRFQSKIYDATMVGLNTTLTYYTNPWFGLEGNLITGFAPTIYQNEHVKMFGGSGGIRIGGRRARFEPFGHALVGGAHLQPQTAGNSKTALMVQTGIGVDYRVHSRLSFRVEGDWVYTQFFGDSQNNFQGVAGAVLHF